MKKYFVFYILAISLMFCLSSIVYAFYIVSQETSDLIFMTGNLEYEFTEDGYDNVFIEKNNDFIVPGEELIKENQIVYIVNKSTISSQLRVIIEVDIGDVKYYLSESTNEGIVGELTDDWVYVESEKTWYYKDTEGEIPAVTQNNQSENINILSSLKINGNKLGNSIETKEVVIKIIYQAKQADYAEWDNVEEISINLGN